MFTVLLSAGEYFSGTFWAFVPAILAIVLALITKQVYLSLFAGIFLGAMFLADGNPILALGEIVSTMGEKVGGNIGILIFLVMLGILVILMAKAGGTKAYGDWAASKIKSKKGALGATAGLGILIFVDDYFNCLTVGNVMRPVTDKFGVSRAKLAYLIDSTAAPVCIIAPISSWAAAVASYAPEGESGLILFIKTIPFNLYALLTLAMVIFVIVRKFDFGKMRHNEQNAEKGDLLSGETELPSEDIPKEQIGKNGKVRYLVIPIIVLIVTCVGAMIYSGYFFDWDLGKLGTVAADITFIDSFSNCDAGSSLAIGSTITVIFTIIYYACAKVVNFKSSMESIAAGFKSMVPAILILILAWTISGVMGAKGGALDASGYVETTLTANMPYGIIPAIFFLLAAGISFATGTSWGTFGILLGIVVPVTQDANAITYILSMSAVLAGSVYGDHVSPISDTTILASSGAQCNHLDHVRTQLPYATLVAVVCFISYIAAGYVAVADLSYGVTALITLVIGFALLFGSLFAIYMLEKSGKLDKLYAKFDARRIAKGKHSFAVQGDMAEASVAMTDDIVSSTSSAEFPEDEQIEEAKADDTVGTEEK